MSCYILCLAYFWYTSAYTSIYLQWILNFWSLKWLESTSTSLRTVGSKPHGKSKVSRSTRLNVIRLLQWSYHSACFPWAFRFSSPSLHFDWLEPSARMVKWLWNLHFSTPRSTLPWSFSQMASGRQGQGDKSTTRWDLWVATLGIPRKMWRMLYFWRLFVYKYLQMITWSYLRLGNAQLAGAAVDPHSSKMLFN